MNILFIVRELSPDGAVGFTLDLMDALQWFGVASMLFVLRPVDWSVAPGLRERIIEGSPPGVRRRYADPVAAIRLFRSARRADVIVSLGEVWPQIAATVAVARVARKPAVAMVQNHPQKAMDEYVGSNWSKRAGRAAYRHLDIAVCASGDLVEPVLGLGCPPENVKVVGNGIDVARVRSLAAESQARSLPGGPVVVGIGRLAEQKGFDVLIRAHAKVRAEGLEHRVVILGEGGDRPLLEGLAAELGVSDSVELAGYVDNPFPTLAAATVLCLPSRYEGWGLVLAEALVLGIPVIASDCVSGPSEVLEGGRYGDLVPVESVDALADALSRHLKDPGRLLAKAQLGSENADDMSVRGRATEYAEIFREVVPRALISPEGR